jgi:hypothetical protein
MTAQFTVTASAAAQEAGDVAQVVAALPVSLHPASDRADLVGIAGEEGWPEAAAEAIASGARGVLVVDPVAADVEALIERASAAGVPVVIDSPWSENPAVPGATEAFAAQHDPDSFAESRIDAPLGADLDRVLLNQLALIRAALGPVGEIRFARRTDRGYDAVARLESGVTAGLSAILSDALPHSATLRVLRSTTAVEVALPAPVTAAPGHVTVSGPDGATLLPTLWETAHRAVWRRLHRLVDAGRTADDLAGFARDVAAVRRAV